MCGLSSLFFACGLGIGLVSIPLLALAEGYNETQIGLLIASSAVAQMVMRTFLGALLRTFPDKLFIIVSCLLVAISCGVFLLSTSLAIFIIAELAQGTARAFFWTGLQAHVVRTAQSAVSGFTLLHIAGGLGGLIGPAVAGILAETSIILALAAGAVISALTAIAGSFLLTLPVSAGRQKEPGALWRRPGVGAASWAVLGTGVWKGSLSSYIPVVLSLAGQPAWVVGVLVAIGNGAGLSGSASAAKLRTLGMKKSLLVGIIATGVGLVALGPLAGFAVPVGFAIFIGGYGAGALETLAPATATELVHPEERGDVIASVGLFRAGALFAAPMAMAGIVLVAPLSMAFVIVGGLVTAPSLALRSLSDDQRRA